MGRPQFKPTKQQRERVMRLRADGWSLERIARRIGIDAKTLDLHFALELQDGADIKREEILEYAEKGAKKGNASLIKWLSEQRQTARAADQLEQRARGPVDEELPAPRPPKLGKKQQQQQQAESVGGKYAPPPGPKLLN